MKLDEVKNLTLHEADVAPEQLSVTYLFRLIFFCCYFHLAALLEGNSADTDAHVYGYVITPRHFFVLF